MIEEFGTSQKRVGGLPDVSIPNPLWGTPPSPPSEALLGLQGPGVPKFAGSVTDHDVLTLLSSGSKHSQPVSDCSPHSSVCQCRSHRVTQSLCQKSDFTMTLHPEKKADLTVT